MGKYATSPTWADIMPIAQDDGPGTPLAAISYSDSYSEATSYLRAVMAANEFSARVLALTADVISMNPAHYTVWLYRAKTLFHLSSEAEAHEGSPPQPQLLRDEISYLNDIALTHLKNYQIWHHRQLIVDRLGDPTGEAAFCMEMFERDAKNYHVWSYRQWLVRRFGLWDSEQEISDAELLVERDVRNNSAWCHRWFLIFGREEEEAKGTKDAKSRLKEDVVARELEYAKRAIRLAPQNQSPWNYLRGLYRKAGRSLVELRGFAEQFAISHQVDNGDDEEEEEGEPSQTIEELDLEEGVRSSHALDLVADIYAELGERDKARTVLEVLGRKWDPVRKGYWNYKAGLLPVDEDKEEEGGTTALPARGHAAVPVA